MMMDREHSEASDQDRIEKLEKRVEYLEKLVGERQRAKAPGSHASSEREYRRSTSTLDSTTEKNRTQRDTFKDRFSIPSILKENWLYWMGVGLLLLGVVFLFNYSIEQGWLIPPIRSAFGLLVGSILFWLGYKRLEGEKIRQFLMGAGIGAFYITGFATFQLYSFLSYPVAFSFMLAVTVLSFGSSVRQNSATLSLIGTLGGLATPFMLYQEEGSLLLLILYSCTIMTGAAAIYQFKEWGSLLWSMFVGGSMILMVALVANVLDVLEPLFMDRWVLQSSLLYMLGLVWLLPVVKEFKNGPGNIPGGAYATQQGSEKPRPKENPHIQALTLLIPVLAVQYTHGIWSLSDINLGFLALAGSVLTAGLCFPLRRAGFRDLSTTHMFSALVLFTQALFLFFEGNMLLVVITLEAVALRYASTRYSDQIVSLGSHFLIVIAWFLMGGTALFSTSGGLPILNVQSLSELLVLVSTGLIIPIYLSNSRTADLYQLVAHIGVLGWLASELTPLENGQMVTSVAWGIYAVLILTAGFWFRQPKLRGVGIVTLLLVVGKLFFVDLSQTSALLRIPLFMGFGALLLLIGYFLQKYWSDDEEDDSGSRGAGV
jgi:uncharacterized membrane protein